MGADKAALQISGEPLLRRVVRRLALALAQVIVIGPPELAALLEPLAAEHATGQAAKQTTDQEAAPSALLRAEPGAETRVIPDAQPGLGPLGGLATALGAITTPFAFVIACDMPFVQPALIRMQARLALAGYKVAEAQKPDASEAALTASDARLAYDVVALRTTQGLEPLHAVYARACASIVQAQLDAGDLAMRRLLARLRVRELTADEMMRADPQGVSTLNANTPDEWAHALALDGDAATDA
jgi:molybdopterin-guanine dinucleotide biosynthesis protein A